jgi:RNA recognition motif-containing protein
MTKIYVGNLPFQTTESEVGNVFSQFGEIKDITFIRDRFTNQFKGFGFITFATQDALESALSMDGKNFMERPLRVSVARAIEAGRSGSGRSGWSRGRDRQDRD